MRQLVKLSVIIPTYLRPEETLRCVQLISDSKSDQYDFQFEYLVVDDSPDKETQKILSGFSNANDVKYIRLQKHTGIGEKRNIAIRRATFPLLLLVDTDIQLSSDTTHHLVDFLYRNPMVARVTGKSKFTNGKPDRPTEWDRVITRNNTMFIEGIYGRYELMYKTPFVEIGGYDPVFAFRGEGTDLSIRYWRAGYPLGFAESAEAIHNELAKASATRSRQNRVVEMYRSLQLIVYKYGLGEERESPNFIRSHRERMAAYGESTEYYAILAGAQALDWAVQHRRDLRKTRRLVPRSFDFKPFDVFSNKELLERCLEESSDRIANCYRSVFGNDPRKTKSA